MQTKIPVCYPGIEKHSVQLHPASLVSPCPFQTCNPPYRNFKVVEKCFAREINSCSGKHKYIVMQRIAWPGINSYCKMVHGCEMLYEKYTRIISAGKTCKKSFPLCFCSPARPVKPK